VTRPADDGGSPPVDDFASSVLDVVDSIPPGRVMSYGDIAEYLGSGPGPRQVGRVMAIYGSAVAWWRVIHSDGTPAPGHDSVALRHYLAEGTPLRSARPPVRVDMRRARWPGRPTPPRVHDPEGLLLPNPMPVSRITPVGPSRERGKQHQSHQHHKALYSRSACVDHDDGRVPDALKPGIHCARTHWIRGFMTFQLARRTRTVMLMVPV
jgi:alkylated DNA nucleotide flippase Atl1